MPESVEQEILLAAVQCASAATRSAYLDQACKGDAALRARVDALLQAQAEAQERGTSAGPEACVCGEACVDTGARAVRPAVQEGPGVRIGRYTLLERIGEGGFGVVWLAEQEEPVRRRVALKIIKLGMDTREVVTRFEAERQALAMMDHPNIAAVFDGGVTESGRPYFVMELVRGIPITTFCDEQRFTVRQRVELFILVCHAVQHAHQKGVIHRDLKPSNILVARDGTRPVPKVIDFGIAKATADPLTDKTLFTQFQQFIGTPAYMSPEQTSLSSLDVDTRSDVYTLGVLLYELLAGRTPFDLRALLEAGYSEVERTIREKEAPWPSQRFGGLAQAERVQIARARRTEPARLTSQLRGDLDRIALKCLQKVRARRYETANALAMDLMRHLNNEPVLARPDAAGYRVAKFVRRHRAPVAFSLLSVAALGAGLVGTIVQAKRAVRHAVLADEQRDFALRQLSRAEAINELNAFLLSDAAPSGRPFTASELLARAEAILDREDVDAVENRVEMLVAIGRQYQLMDEDAKAYELLAKAHALAGELPDRSLRAKAGAAYARALSYAGQLDRAEEVFQHALAELPDEPQFAVHRVFCLMQGSGIANERGDVTAGVARIEEAQRLLKQSRQSSALAELRLSIELAESYRIATRSREALPAFEAAFARLTALGRDHTERAGTLLNNMGLTLDALGRPLEAEQCFLRAITIGSEDATGRGVSPQLLNNLARTLRDLGRFEEAARVAEQALAEARERRHEIALNQTLLNLAHIDRERGEWTRAAEWLDELGPRLSRMLPAGHFGFASFASARGALELDRGNVAAAREEIDRAVRINGTATERRAYLAGVLRLRAKLHLHERRLDQAKADAVQALALEQEQVEPGAVSCRVGRAWLTLGRILAAQGAAADARVALRAAQEQLAATLGSDHADTRSAREGAGEG